MVIKLSGAVLTQLRPSQAQCGIEFFLVLRAGSRAVGVQQFMCPVSNECGVCQRFQKGIVQALVIILPLGAVGQALSGHFDFPSSGVDGCIGPLHA